LYKDSIHLLIQFLIDNSVYRSDVEIQDLNATIKSEFIIEQ